MEAYVETADARMVEHSVFHTVRYQMEVRCINTAK